MFRARTEMIADDIFDAEVEGHTVRMDTGSAEKAGQSPMELLLSAISGCASVDVAGIMKKKRRQVDGLVVETEAERRDDPMPRIFTRINLHFILSSPDAKDGELAQAVSLAMDKYCSVGGMLEKAARIDYSWEIRTG